MTYLVLIREHWYQFIVGFIFLLVVFFHVWQLDSLPRGLYVDETSIGHNAYLIAQAGHDEHNVRWPVFFEAFGEYKNPLHIYLTALLFKLFGVSVFTLRLASALFAIALAAIVFFFAKTLFHNRLLTMFALIAAGFLPWFFAMSRVAFEVISQTTIVMAALFFIYRTYELRARWLDRVLAGFFIGLSVYTYSTARLLTFLMIVAISVVYFQAHLWKQHAIVALALAVTLIPYVIFSLHHPGALLARFHLVSYWYDPAFSVSHKVGLFFRNYFYYLSFKYLLFSGDGQLRHHSGFRGELFISVFILVWLGLIGLIINRHLYTNRFLWFLASQVFLAPVAAALTTGDSSLRTVLVGLYAVIFSLFGLWMIISISDHQKRNALVWLFMALLIVESGLYVQNYFSKFPQKSISAFETYDYEGIFVNALRQKPSSITVSDRVRGGYTAVEFYKEVYRPEVPVTIGTLTAQKNTCVLFNKYGDSLPDETKLSVRVFTTYESFVTAHCYQ